MKQPNKQIYSLRTEESFIFYVQSSLFSRALIFLDFKIQFARTELEIHIVPIKTTTINGQE